MTIYYTGLSVTYTTSYEALVGRAKLQAGAYNTFNFVIDKNLKKNSVVKVNGYSC